MNPRTVESWSGRVRRVVGTLLVTAMVAVALPASVGAAAEPAVVPGPAGVTGVTASDDVVEITGVVNPDDEVAIHALGPAAEEQDWHGARPVATAEADGDGAFTATLRVGDDDARSSHLYYAKYLAVVDDAPVGTYRYVDDNRVTATNDYPYPQSPTKKGLQVQMTADAEELGAGHAGINIALDQLLRLEDEGADRTISFRSGGREFHVDRAYVEHLDQVISSVSDNGMVVDLILILYRNDHPNSAFDVLVHPDWDPAGGPVFAFNTATDEGVAHYTAALEFIAERWTREDARHGRATGFIVGNEIDAQWVWSNMGQKPLDEFVRYYERALRIAHQAVSAAYHEGRVYTSLTHSWTLPSGPEDPAGRYYPGRDVLDALNRVSKAHGDYPWHVAHHPYPEDLNDPAFWEDETATTDVETTGRITFKNLELLDGYLQRDELTYDGDPRRVILSEQGCNTPGEDRAAQELQAACYALAYYKVAFLDAIDAFILHRHVDYKTEFGLRLGLWTWDDERPEQSAPDERKVIYDVFRDIDTDRSLEVTEFALDVIGIDDWSELVPGWDEGALAVRERPTVGGASATARPSDGLELFDFAGGAQGWTPSDGVDTVVAEDGRLRSRFTFEPSLAANLAKMWRGPEVTFDEPLDATTRPYLSVRVRVPDDPEIGTRYAKIKAYATDGTIGEGTVRLEPGDEWQQAMVDLSDWGSRSEIVRMKVWLRGSNNAAWSGSFDIDDVTLAARISGERRVVNLDVEARAPEQVRVGRPVSITVTNHDLAPARGALRIEPCDGLAVDPPELALGGLAPGEVRDFEVTIVAAEGADLHAPRLCPAVLGSTFETTVDVPPPTPVSIHDFDDGTTQGWAPGENVASVEPVTGTANAPGSPHGGSHALEGASHLVPGDAPRTIVHEPDDPLDLGDVAEVVVALNSYGGAPGATGYEASLTLHAGDDAVTTTQSYRPDTWNDLTVDVQGWPGRGAVDRIEVTMRAVGDDLPEWNPRFQIDSFRSYDVPRRD